MSKQTPLYWPFTPASYYYFREHSQSELYNNFELFPLNNFELLPSSAGSLINLQAILYRKRTYLSFSLSFDIHNYQSDSGSHIESTLIKSTMGNSYCSLTSTAPGLPPTSSLTENTEIISHLVVGDTLSMRRVVSVEKLLY